MKNLLRSIREISLSFYMFLALFFLVFFSKKKENYNEKKKEKNSLILYNLAKHSKHKEA